MRVCVVRVVVAKKKDNNDRALCVLKKRKEKKSRVRNVVKYDTDTRYSNKEKLSFLIMFLRHYL